MSGRYLQLARWEFKNWPNKEPQPEPRSNIVEMDNTPDPARDYVHATTRAKEGPGLTRASHDTIGSITATRVIDPAFHMLTAYPVWRILATVQWFLKAAHPKRLSRLFRHIQAMLHCR